MPAKIDTYLFVVLKPFGSNPGDSIILVSLAGGDTSELHGISVAHAANQLWVDLLLKMDSLFYRKY
jgi:hypothetical protein